uniref:hypothetical protein n=1 Tax=Chloroflexus aggregans TaxID=152260 RepID=UPI0038BB5D2F
MSWKNSCNRVIGCSGKIERRLPGTAQHGARRLSLTPHRRAPGVQFLGNLLGERDGSGHAGRYPADLVDHNHDRLPVDVSGGFALNFSARSAEKRR